jgi:hypothetical protein
MRCLPTRGRPLKTIMMAFSSEWRCVTPVGSVVGLGAPGERSQGHEARHRATTLEFVPGGVGVVWASLLKELSIVP